MSKIDTEITTLNIYCYIHILGLISSKRYGLPSTVTVAVWIIIRTNSIVCISIINRNILYLSLINNKKFYAQILIMKNS